MRTQRRLQKISTSISLVGLALGSSVLGLLIVAKEHDGGPSITGGILGILLGAAFLIAACLHRRYCDGASTPSAATTLTWRGCARTAVNWWNSRQNCRPRTRRSLTRLCNGRWTKINANPCVIRFSLVPNRARRPIAVSPRDLRPKALILLPPATRQNPHRFPRRQITLNLRRRQ